MTRTIHTDYYYYIYDNDEADMIWYSPSSDDKQKCNRNLLNCIEEARRILRRNPAADLEICGRATDICGEYEDGAEYDFHICTKNELDQTEQKIRKAMKK